MGAMTEMPDYQDQVYEMNVRLGFVQKATEAKSLSIREINKLSDQVADICQKALRVQQVASTVLSSDVLYQGMKLAETLEEKRSRIWESDRKLLKKLHAFDFAIEELRDKILFITDEEAAMQLSELYEQVKKFCEAHPDNSARVEKAIFLTLQKIADVDFALRFSICSELYEESYQENFAQKIRSLAQQFLENKKSALLEFLTLSEGQRNGVYQALAIGKGIGSLEEAKKMFHDPSLHNFERARAIHTYLEGLKELCSMAKTALYEDATKAYHLFDSAPDALKMRIEQLTWARTGKKLEDLFLENPKEYCVSLSHAIMALVNEKILE